MTGSSVREDPDLIGRIWRSSDGQFVSAEQMHEHLRQVDYLLLGEKHDNPAHHRERLTVLDELIASTGVAALGMEMFAPEQQVFLNQLRGQGPIAEQDLPGLLQWDSGWHWPFYAPVIRTALNHNIPLYAANLSRDEVMSIYEADEYRPDTHVMNRQQLERLYRDIDTSHCGLLPESQLTPMVVIQQSRDRRMAQSLLAVDASSEQVGPGILLAGNYHVRQDLGVPLYLRAAKPEAQIVVVAFIEVDETFDNAAQYLEQFSDIAAYDYIWFTQAVDTEDYCESLR